VIPERISTLAWVPAALFLLAASGVVACGELPRERGRLAVTFAAATEFRRALVVGEGEDAIDVTRLQLQLREVKFLPDEADSPDGESPARVHEAGTFFVDVLDPDASDFEVEVDPGLYKKVEFKVDKPDDGEGIDGTDAALWVEGTRGGVRFRFTDDRMMKLTFRDVDLDVPAGGIDTLLVDLDVPRWLADVDLGALAAGDDGRVDITPNGPNARAHRQIEGNITDAIRALRHPAR